MKKPKLIPGSHEAVHAVHEHVRYLLGHTLMYHGNEIAAECDKVAGRRAAAKRLANNIFVDFKKEWPEAPEWFKKELIEHCDEILQENIDGNCFVTPVAEKG